MIYRKALPVFTVLLCLSFACAPCLAAGPQPCAWVSIVSGRDIPGCGAHAAPCRTAQYAHDFVVMRGGAIYIEDIGHFGEPSIVTAIEILGAKLSGYPW
jgi:hypothetical protein